jgi:hypothetical protein
MNGGSIRNTTNRAIPSNEEKWDYPGSDFDLGDVRPNGMWILFGTT